MPPNYDLVSVNGVNNYSVQPYADFNTYLFNPVESLPGQTVPIDLVFIPRTDERVSFVVQTYSINNYDRAQIDSVRTWHQAVPSQ